MLPRENIPSKSGFEKFVENTLNLFTDQKLLSRLPFNPYETIKHAYTNHPGSYNERKRIRREDMKSIEEREQGLTGPQKFKRRLSNYASGQSRPAFGSALVEKDWDEADKDYITPILPEESTEAVKKIMELIPGKRGDKAIPFIYDAFREVTSPADIDFTIAMMLTKGQVNPIQAQSLKAMIAAKTVAPKTTKTLFNPSQGVIRRYSSKAPIPVSTKAKVFNNTIKKPAKVIGHVLRPYGYHTPGLKGYLVRGGAEIALGTAFVSGMRGVDAGIQKYAPEFAEEHPNISAGISMLAGG